MGQAEERNRLDIVGFREGGLRVTGGGDVLLCWASFFCAKGLKRCEFFDWDVKEKPHPLWEDSFIWRIPSRF